MSHFITMMMVNGSYVLFCFSSNDLDLSIEDWHKPKRTCHNKNKFKSKNMAIIDHYYGNEMRHHCGNEMRCMSTHICKIPALDVLHVYV